MIDIYQCEEYLYETFSQKKVFADIFSELKACFSIQNETFECLVDGYTYKVPTDFDLQVTSICFRSDTIPKFRGVRVIVAVGGVEGEENGFIKPKFFFVKINYDEFYSVVSIDISKDQFFL